MSCEAIGSKSNAESESIGLETKTPFLIGVAGGTASGKVSLLIVSLHCFFCLNFFECYSRLSVNESWNSWAKRIWITLNARWIWDSYFSLKFLVWSCFFVVLNSNVVYFWEDMFVYKEIDNLEIPLQSNFSFGSQVFVKLTCIQLCSSYFNIFATLIGGLYKPRQLLSWARCYRKGESW